MSRVGIYLLDVGQGDATIVLLPDPKRAVLFDCRDAYVATQLLENWKVEHLHVVVSHLDEDHIAGIAEILEHFVEKVEAVHLSADRKVTDDAPRASMAREVIDAARAEDRRYLFSGLTAGAGSGAQAQLSAVMGRPRSGRTIGSVA